MNPLDMIIIVIFGFCLIRGLFRGLIKELSSIVGVFAGFYAAYTYYSEVAGLLSRWIADKNYLNLLSFLIIFVVIFLIISILGIIIKYLMNIAYLGWIDRICGGGFGSIKAILISSVLLFALTTFLPKGTPVVRDSLLSPHVTFISERLAKIVSKDMKQQYRLKIKELKKTWKIPR